MIIPTFQCDECGEQYKRVANLTLSGQVGLAQREMTFCSWTCLDLWINKTMLRTDEMRKFCQPEREPKCK